MPHLTRQLDYLTREREHLDTLISTLQKPFKNKRRKRNEHSKKFAGFNYQDHQKIPPRGGREIWTRSHGPSAGAPERSRRRGYGCLQPSFQALAQNLQAGLPVTATENQEQTAKLLQAIRTYGFDCTIEVFGHIGKGYVYNPEFKENIDKFGTGTAQYTSDVIAHYVQTQAKIKSEE